MIKHGISGKLATAAGLIRIGEAKAFAGGTSRSARLACGIDWVLFLGILVLIAFVLRTPDVRTAWRAILFVLGAMSIPACLAWRPVAWAGLVPAVRGLIVLGAIGVALMIAASVAGSTLAVSRQQFLLGFLLPLLLPWLILNHVRTRQRWRLLLYVFVVAALLLCIRNLLQYVQEWNALGRLSNDIHLHRRYAINLVFGLPFLLWLAVAGRPRWLAAAGGLLSLTALVMIVGTGARAAWLAAALVLLLFVILLRNRRLMLAAMIGVVLAAVIGATVVPPELLLDRLRQGMDTSGRVTGAWGPALEIMGGRPWTGYGFGDAVFDNEFNRRVASADNWIFKQSYGPHNFFLAIGVAAGIPAVAAMLCTLAAAIALVGLRILRQPPATGWCRSGIALIAAVCGTYLVIGNFENLQWNLLAIWFGMTLAWLQLDGSEVSPAADGRAAPGGDWQGGAEGKWPRSQ